MSSWRCFSDWNHQNGPNLALWFCTRSGLDNSSHDKRAQLLESLRHQAKENLSDALNNIPSHSANIAHKKAISRIDFA